MTPEQRSAILSVLGQIHITDDMEEEDIKAKEQVRNTVLGMEDHVIELHAALFPVSTRSCCFFPHAKRSGKWRLGMRLLLKCGRMVGIGSYVIRL